MIKNFIKNENSTCPKCGYYKDKIIDEKNLTYYKIISKVEYPKFLFIGFDFSIGSDIENIEGEVNSIDKQNLLSFNRLKDNLDLIKNLILENILIYNTSYNLIGIVSTPYSGHYNGIIINMKDDINLLKKNSNYFCDGQKNDNFIIPVENWREFLDYNYPYVLIYVND